MVTPIPIHEFLEKAKKIKVIDVRSPKEFQKGHIPQAYNLPLFSDEERAKVGKMYKHEGTKAAILLGMKLVGPKMAGICRQLEMVTDNNKEILLYCWRGGMRSNSMAWLFETYGYKTYTLIRGYKAYRNEVIQAFSKKTELVNIGGMTGSGKTQILQELQNIGEQTIDLETVAHHKGSAFGFIGQQAQPTSEQFENDLHSIWQTIDFSRIVWIEDESIMIGNVFIPEKLWKQMQESPVIVIEMDKSLRINRLVNEYSTTDNELLIIAIERITKKLGGLNTKQAIEAVKMRDFHKAADIILSYYDKAYHLCLDKKDNSLIYPLRQSNDNPYENAKLVRDLYLSGVSASKRN
jgi:tRNA 2-selenouridine synthase